MLKENGVLDLLNLLFWKKKIYFSIEKHVYFHKLEIFLQTEILSKNSQCGIVFK